MISRQEGRGLHDRLSAAFRAIGLEPHLAPTPSIFGAVLPLVAASAGWVPASETMAAQAIPGVVSIRLHGFDLATGFDVIWWRESAPGGGSQRLVEGASAPRRPGSGLHGSRGCAGRAKEVT
jgi:DNA-binding transcriptional LysR family regulator